MLLAPGRRGVLGAAGDREGGGHHASKLNKRKIIHIYENICVVTK